MCSFFSYYEILHHKMDWVQNMNKKIKERVLEECEYILNSNDTIREIAKKFHVSKSTVHQDLSKRLKKIDALKYKQVLDILKYHLDIRHLRGGEATKQKYLSKNCQS